MELTDAERQMIEIIRREFRDEFRLSIELQNGAWEIAMSGLLTKIGGGEKLAAARGVGASFDAAWHNMVPTWA